MTTHAAGGRSGDAARPAGAGGEAEALVVHVSAVVVVDGAGRALVVRKRGAHLFQQPGGKPDPGETPAGTARRETAEEIGVDIAEDRLEPLGRFTDTAANEPGHLVVADAFRLRLRPDEVAAVASAAEIAELRWVTRDELGSVPLAPLSRGQLLPLAWV